MSPPRRPSQHARPRPHARRRPARRWRLPASLFAAFVLMALAVQGGKLHGLDHFGFRHLPPLGDSWKHLTDPAEPPVAGFIMAMALLRLRDRRPLAVAWAAAFGASLVIELVGKAVIDRPFAKQSHGLWSVHGTFPSGHTMRAVVVAGALTAAWPRYRQAFAAWAAATALLVELTGMHSISEVLGGALAGLGLVTAVHAWQAARRLPSPARGTRRAPSRRRQRRRGRRAPARR